MPSRSDPGRSEITTLYTADRSVGVDYFKPGNLFWLPKKKICAIQVSDIEGDIVVDDCYNHPILVFATNRQDKKILALVITSFGGTSVQDKFPGDHQCRARCEHLPLAPATHPDEVLHLTLRDGLTLRSNSYLKVRRPIVVHAEVLEELRVGRRRLTSKSLKELDRWIQSHKLFSLPIGYSGRTTRTVIARPLANDVYSTLADHATLNPHTVRVAPRVNLPPSRSYTISPSSARGSLYSLEGSSVKPERGYLQAPPRDYGAIGGVHEPRSRISANAHMPPISAQWNTREEDLLPIYNRGSSNRTRRCANAGPPGSCPSLWLAHLVLWLSLFGLGCWGLVKLVGITGVAVHKIPTAWDKIWHSVCCHIRRKC